MARYDTDEFIRAQNLDPKEWHVAGEPTPKAASATEPAPSADSLVRPGKNSQGQVVPAPGRASVDWTVTLTGPGGEVRVVTMRPTGAGVDAPNVGLNQLDWNVTGVDQQVKPPTAGQTPAEQNARVAEAQANAVTAQAKADAAASDLRKVQEDERERQYNQSQGNGYLTHEELRKLNQDAQANNLTQDQINLRRTEIENNNKNTARSNEISALNASTAAANAATTAQATTARIKYEEGQGNLDEAKFEHQKAQDEIANRNAETKIKLDQLTQQQANEINQGTLAARTAEGAETARNNAAVLAQRTAEANQVAQTAQQTAGIQAASTTYGNELQAATQAGTVGGNLLANRVTGANNLINNILSGVGGMAQGSAGRYGMLGGGLHAMPAGFSGADLVSGAYGVVGNAMGGQDTLNAAARMVRNAAPGAELTPIGQAAIGVLQQAFEKHQQLTGAPHPAPAAEAAARAGAANGGAAAPVTTPSQAPAAPVQPSVTVTVAPQNQVAGANYGADRAYTGGIMPWNAQPGPSFQAPVTVGV